MERVIRVKEMFETIKNTSSTNDKKKLLAQFREHDLFIKILEFTLNTYKVTGLSKKKMNKVVDIKPTVELDTIDEALEYIIKHNTGRDEDIANVKAYIQTLPEEVQDFYTEIFMKSYKLGANAKLVNSVITNLIPTFNIMLAESYAKNTDFVLGKRFILTTKLDGNRLIVLVYPNETVRCYTRQGKEVEGLVDIVKEFKRLPPGAYDGEILATGEYSDSKEQFQETMKRARIKGIKTGLNFMCFDYIDNLDDFFNGKCNTSCEERKNRLEQIISNGVNLHHIKYLKPLYIGEDISKIKEFSDIAKENNEEGIMLNIANAPYEYKRTKNILKVKVMQDCDIRCVDIEEGDGRLKGTLGRIICSYKGYTLKVGSGFADKDRKEIWDNPDKILNKIVKIQYFEETQNQDGGLSLRFPVFLDIRDDKDVESYN